MPRSGTTLVEQIVAAHSEVHGAGELGYLARLVENMPEKSGVGQAYPGCLQAVSENRIAVIADEYLAQLRTLAPRARRIVDKMPGNYQHLGLFALLFPNARVIHCLRDPFDTALSCFFQNFVMERDFTTDLSILGRVYAAYVRLMDHWRRVLPMPVFDVRYEALVADVESSGRQLIDFCELDWQPGCLEFHRHPRQIRTSSFWQVRQPVYTSAVGRSESYRLQLTGFAEALARCEKQSGDAV